QEGMSKNSEMDDKMDHSKTEMKMDSSKTKAGMEMDHSKMDHSNKGKRSDSPSKMAGMDHSTMDEINMFAEYNYDYLKSPEKTDYDKDLPIKKILLNLTGNMQRYVWSINGVPLSETDNIKISGKEVTRITFNNLTMMHHPMHLHGHFFRVINNNGEYSPLK